MPRHPYVDIPELGRMHSGEGLIRIPPDLDVPFSKRVRRLVDCVEFRRLAGISQLGLVSRVYPGATHSRFEHALGVYHNALRYLWQLGKDSRFAACVDPKAAELLMAAALLHDLGHWPMAHPIEDIELEGQPSHEQFAARFLAPDSELAAVLQSDWSIAAGEVLDVLHPQHLDPQHLDPQHFDPQHFDPQRRLIRSLLSGPVDVDKLDYLERDSLHCGVPYGRNFDKNRLISSLLVNEAGDGLALSSKGKTAAELMIFARYVMFGEVYWHHAVRSATAMFARAFFELRRCFTVDVLQLGEADLISWLKKTAETTPWQALVDGVFGPRRGLYKRTLELSRFSHPELYDRLAHRSFAENAAVATELASRLGARLGEAISAADVLLDAPPRHREVETHLELYDAKLQVYRPLKDISPVVRSLATTQFDDYVKRVRVFVHPRLAGRLDGDDEITRGLSRSIETA